jgi:nucleotide-binding universal stress UspA family protein
LGGAIVVKPILHPTDFSAASRSAFRKALDLAHRLRAPVLIVHVVSPAAALIGNAFVSPQLYIDIERAMKADAQRRLDRTVASAEAKGVRAVGVLREGSTWEEIVKIARSRQGR